jgi:hypothetical protein
MTGDGVIKTDLLNTVSGNGMLFQDPQGLFIQQIRNYTGQNLTIKAGFGQFVNMANVNTISFDTTGAGAITNLQTINGLPYPPASFRDSTEFFVSDSGSDTTGNGSFGNPYRTIQKAITQAELVSSAALVCVINVASGHYNENLTFNKGYVVLNGSLQSQTGNEICEITGSILINCIGANDVFNRQVAFQGFNITCGVGQLV